MSIAVLFFVVACAVAPVDAAPKKWTFMVFLNADNNLDPYGVEDMNEMAKIGSSDFANIVVLIDREKGPATLNYIEKGKITLLKEMGEIDMGDYNVLVDFVKSTAAAYPAEHYAVIAWNHGSGWKDGHDAIIKGISYDDESGNHITTNQLTIACQQIKAALGKNIDIFAFDACLMQMAEVAHAIPGVDYIVASEEVEPGAGWPYDGVLSGLTRTTTPAQFAAHIVKAYAASYNGGSQGSSSGTQSALEMKNYAAFKDAVDGFAKAAMAGNYGPQFKDALNKVQKFYYRTNIDLPHFVELLKVTVNDAGFQTACDKLLAASAKLIIANGLSGYSTKNAKGLAIYFPASSYSFSAPYNDLAFAKDTLWDEMVQDYYKKTTAATVVSDVENGDLSSLMAYVSTANENNREVSAHLINKLNFRVFTEGGFDSATQESVRHLIAELKNK
ncbi:MAG: Clostripain [Candidatus Ozemobacter sibiricus]|uniref:Clostripain n=1 Tax=Candidatus Ozemobacter sibiricus TaxID=2268124 RepID=A0A367ZPJ2_9BACT|nr:MAG: Clostripain [Candidatus Ozemobacter sibiricus]